MAEQETINNPRIQILTDEAIAMYSENNILTEWADINLKILTCIKLYANGVYDQDIFGSIFSDRCNCGNIKTPGIRCPKCGSMVLDEVQSFRRFARIELPVLYSTKFKLDKLSRFIKSNFCIQRKVTSAQFKDLPWNDSLCLDCLQWEWDAENETLIQTDNITNYLNCSYEGLLKIIQEYFPDKLTEYRAYLNQYILVIPMVLRAPSIKMVGKNRVFENHETTVIYQNILYATQYYYKNTFPSLKDEITKALFRGSLRKMISSSLDSLSKLMNSSKQNLARSMQSNRLPNSGRCTIVPDPTLKADEVVIPFHLMYEACRSEFIKYIQEKKGVGPKEAEYIYKMQSDLDEVQQMFENYINGDGDPKKRKKVVINRAPSLYEFGMFCCDVKLSHDYAMKLPPVLCKPTNGDFDGDTMSFYAVPKDMNDLMEDALGARNRFYYKKDHTPLFTPTHEFMAGLILATKVKIPNHLETFDSIDQADQFRKENPEFKYQTLCMIKGEKTTLGRAILSDLFDKNLESYLGNFNTTLNAKNINILYAQLNDKKDRLERIQKIQEFAAKIATVSGATTVKLSDLYIDLDESYLKRIRAIEDDPKIEQKSKEIKIREVYAEYQKVELEKIPEDVRMMIADSARAKLEDLTNMAVQQLNVGPDHEYSVGESTLTGGMTSVDYYSHVIENRALQDIKKSGVPASGYITRQFIYLASEYYIQAGEDKDNKGILIEKKNAIGRTMVDGTIIEKNSSDDQVRVRSIVTSTKGKGVITSDMLSNLFNYRVGSKVGMSLVSSLTESLTQAALALKHGGHLYEIDDKYDPGIIAPADGTLEVKSDRIVLHSKGLDYTWPKSSNFTVNYMNPSNTYKKGEMLGRDYHPVTPIYRVDSLIKLSQARSTNPDKRFAKNVKNVSECYAVSDGVIKYNFESDYTQVFIGDVEYTYNPDCIYLYPEGTVIKKYQRFCSGTLDMKSMVYKVDNNFEELFYYFKKQFMELMPIASELIEFLYVLLVNKQDDQLEMRSVLKNIYGSESFFKSLAFGDARKSFQKIDYQGMDFVADPITAVMLSMVMNNEIK